MAALIAPQLTRVREQERWRLCHELHDGVGAAVAGIILCVGAAKGALLGVERQLLTDIVTHGLVPLLASMADMSLVAAATPGKWPG